LDSALAQLNGELRSCRVVQN